MFVSARFNAGLQVFLQVTPPDEQYLAEMLGETIALETKPQANDVDGAAIEAGVTSRPQSRVSNKVTPVSLADSHDLTPVESATPK